MYYRDNYLRDYLRFIRIVRQKKRVNRFITFFGKVRKQLSSHNTWLKDLYVNYDLHLEVQNMPGTATISKRKITQFGLSSSCLILSKPIFEGTIQ